MVSLSILSFSSLIPSAHTLTLTQPPPLPRLSLCKTHRLPKRLASFSSSSPPLCSLSPLSSPGDTAASLPFEDLVEKDWSFRDSDAINSDEERAQKADRIIAAGEVRGDSRVLISLPTVGFVERVVDSLLCELLVVIHESLFVLAMIKEQHEKVRCLQGGIAMVPEKFLPLDAVFICYLPGMGVSLDQLLGSLAKRCSPGARLVISFDQGREIIDKNHRQQYPDMVTSDLPDRIALEKAAADHSFQITELVDDPTFYLAVFKFHSITIGDH